MQTAENHKNTGLIDVNPEIIKWVRVSSQMRLGKIVARTSIDAETIKKLEDGKQKPDIHMLRKLASVCKRPLSVFLLGEVPKEDYKTIDYRMLPDISSNDPESIEALALEMKEALYQREKALDVWEKLELSTRSSMPQISIEEDSEESARRISEGLSFDLTKWRKVKSDNMWASLRRHIEGVGYVVRQAEGISIESMRGYSYYFELLPIIGVNPKDDPKARCFTLLHELAHIALKQGSICDLKDASGDISNKPVEIYCNRIAGSILVPSSELMELLSSKRYRGVSLTEEIVIKSIARHFKASTEVIVRRLVATGMVDKAFYQTYRNELLIRYSKKLLSQKEREYFPPSPIDKVFNVNGLLYVMNTMDAYSAGLLTTSDLLGYLGIKHKHINDITSKILQKQSKVVEF